MDGPELGHASCAHPTISFMTGVLYCGDNLEILANDYIAAESVDLIYLDPPFNSQRTYNVVYKDSRAQAEAFKDYWSWEDAASLYVQYVTQGTAPLRVRSILKTLHDALIDEDSDLLAYLTMMAPRLVAIHRVLKPTGSLYLHCDPTASHYLKVILDAICGSDHFQNEVIWQRAGGKNDAIRYGRSHDSLLFYVKGKQFTWNQRYTAFQDYSVAKNYTAADPDGRRYRLSDLTANKPGGDVDYEWHGKKPYKGRHWAYSRENMDKFLAEGRIVFRRTGMPVYKRYLDEMPGVPLQDVWTDIKLASDTPERVGYPTQKPLALLDRILQISSNPGDIVLDPFCGCGTTIVACEKMGRQWIGIDIARKAVDVLEARFAAEPLPEPSIIWHPADPDAAAALAERDPDQFEAWIRRKIRAEKRKKDRGIDGECFYKDADGKSWHVILSVKGGHSLNPGMVRDLRGTIERENAPIGVLVCMYEPSREMRLEATRAGFLPVSDVGGPIPRIQIVTVEQLFSERVPIRAPGENVTPRVIPAVPQKGQTGLLFPTTKVRPAREAQARAAVDAKVTAAASLAEDASRATEATSGKPPSKQTSRPPKR
jgi:DNA modification methylase